MGPNFCILSTPPRVKYFCADLSHGEVRGKYAGRRTRICVSSSHPRTRLTVSNSKRCFPVYHKYIINENIPPHQMLFKPRRFLLPSSLRYQGYLFLLRQPRSCLAFYIIFPLKFNYVAFIDDPAVVNSSKNVVL